MSLVSSFPLVVVSYLFGFLLTFSLISGNPILLISQLDVLMGLVVAVNYRVYFNFFNLMSSLSAVIRLWLVLLDSVAFSASIVDRDDLSFPSIEIFFGVVMIYYIDTILVYTVHIAMFLFWLKFICVLAVLLHS